MDWLDEAVRHAAPPTLGADPVTAAEAGALAGSIVSRLRERRRGTSLRRLFAGSALSLGIVGLGVTAATAGPAVIDWLGWTPDVIAQRSFDVEEASGLGLCEVFIRVSPEYRDVSDEDADRRTEEARKFLTEHDWEPLIASISANEIQTAFAEEVAQRSVPLPDGTMPPPATMSLVVTQLMANRISTEFDRAGQLRPGVSLEAAAGPCDGATEGSAQ